MRACSAIRLPVSMIMKNLPLPLSIHTHSHTAVPLYQPPSRLSLYPNPPILGSVFLSLHLSLSHTHTRTCCPLADRCGARQHKAMLSWPIETFVRPLWEATQITDHWINEHTHTRGLPMGLTPTHAASHGTQPKGDRRLTWRLSTLHFFHLGSFQLHQCQQDCKY